MNNLAWNCPIAVKFGVGYRNVKSVLCWIMGLVIKAQNDWHDLGRPSSCNASQLPLLLGIIIIISIISIIVVILTSKPVVQNV